MNYRGLIETVIDVDAESEEEAEEKIKQVLAEHIANGRLAVIVWLHEV